MEKEYKTNVYVLAFAFDGDADNFMFNDDVPIWAKEALKDGTIKKRDYETLYIDHREHTDFVKSGDYIIRSEFGRIFSLHKEDFEKSYSLKSDWISCDDRLPTMEEAQRNDGRFILDDGNRQYQGNFDYLENRFVSFGCNGIQTDTCCIAWCELPQPYQGE